LSHQAFSEQSLLALIESGLPCEHLRGKMLRLDENGKTLPSYSARDDFGPHLYVDIREYSGPARFGDFFDILDSLPEKLGMTPIMRPYVVRTPFPGGEYVISGMTMIAESHLSLHFLSNARQLYVDLFSCRPFNYDFIFGQLREIFPGRTLRWGFLGRGKDHRLFQTEATIEATVKRRWIYAAGLGSEQRRKNS
jgi:hypothetical protein